MHRPTNGRTPLRICHTPVHCDAAEIGRARPGRVDAVIAEHRASQGHRAQVRRHGHAARAEPLALLDP
jgi:hypothetical protein